MADCPRLEGDHAQTQQEQHDHPAEAGLSKVAGDEAANNPWHDAQGCGSAGTAMADDTKQPDA
jgi:hypothetical protein